MIKGSVAAYDDGSSPVSSGEAKIARRRRYGSVRPARVPFMRLFTRHSATTCPSSHATPYQSHTAGVIHGPNPYVYPETLHRISALAPLAAMLAVEQLVPGAPHAHASPYKAQPSVTHNHPPAIHT